MATAVHPMTFNHNFPNQCGTSDQDLDNWLDLSPTLDGPSQSSRMPATTSPQSSITSPTTTILPLNNDDDLQTPAKPSHEYGAFKQQTGLPSNSVPGLQSGFRFSNSGIDESMMGWDAGLNFAGDGNLDLDMPMSNPAFFYATGDASQSSNDDFIDPSTISSQEESQQNVRFWPGMHQQQAALAAKAQAQAQQQRQQQMVQQQQKQRAMEQQQQQARAQSSRRSASHQPVDARTEETIARVVNQIRQNSQLASQHDLAGQGSVLPHIVRMKKDEDDMDEDERLLASEEGKKLSSKERRQLRNKVSARAFRSRRKEYIGQLEGEVAVKTNEANELRIQNHALMEENARSRAFIEKLLRHPAFTPFLEDLSRDESINNAVPMTRAAAPTATPTPAPDAKDMNLYGQQFQNTSRPQQNNVQVGMTLVPETPLDLSMLSLNNNNWGVGNMGFNFQQPRVFAVTEVPEGPVNPIDTANLSGKGYESVMADNQSSEEEVKVDCPTIKHAREATTVESAKPAETEEDKAFDNNPAFALYHGAASQSDAPAAPLSIDLGNLNLKQSSQYTLVVSENAEDERALEEMLEKMSAKLDGIYGSIKNLTHHLDS